MKKLIISVFINIKRMEELNLLEKILFNKLSDQLQRSSNNMKKVFIQTLIKKILLLIFLQSGQLLKVAPIKIIKFSLSINLIQLKFQPYFYCQAQTLLKNQIKRYKNVWFKYPLGRVNQLSQLDYQYFQLQLDLTFMKHVIQNI